MKNNLLILILFLLPTFVFAQSAKEKGLQVINRQSAEAHVGFLASDALEGRQAGHHGGRIAAEYIASQLRAIGVPPFRETYFQHFEAYKPTGRKRYSVNPDSIAKWKASKTYSKIDLQNIFGFIEGKKEPNLFLSVLITIIWG